MKCPKCGTESKTAFCKVCGTRVGQGPSPARRVGIVAAAAAAIAVVAVFLILKSRGDGAAVTAEPSGTAVPTGEMTRIQADRVYERIVEAQERGDTAAANALIPTALQAYSLAGDMDSDAMYHATLLFIASGDYKAARDAADQVLTEMPDNPFALSAAGKAAAAQGDTAGARKYYGRFLTTYAAESKRMEYPEQRHHNAALPRMKAEAEGFTGSGKR